MPVDPSDATSVAQGLDTVEEMTLSLGDSTAETQPSMGASAPSSAPTSTPSQPAAGVDAGAGGVAQGDADEVQAEPAAAVADGDGSDDEYTQEDLDALTELRSYLREEAAKEIVPQLQSTYDRQIATLNRQIQEANKQSEARERELVAQIREAQVNGLPEADRAKLQQQWDYEDRLRTLDARETELTSYHTELLRAEYIRDFAEFGLEEGDLDDFSTPEEMDSFVKEVQLEYYRQLAEASARGTVAEAPQAQAAPTKPVSKSAPAGAQAPTDGGGGSAPPQDPKFNPNTGMDAMAENIRSGWETVSLR